MNGPQLHNASTPHSCAINAEPVPTLPRRVPQRRYDPIALAMHIEKSVSTGNSRLYSSFSVSPNYGGCVKGFAVGCDLRCGFCWSPVRSLAEISRVERNRSFALKVIQSRLNGASVNQASVGADVDRTLKEIQTKLYSPDEVVDELYRVYRSREIRGIGAFEALSEGPPPHSIDYFTITGGEPTLCSSHLLTVLRLYSATKPSKKFLLQTHGLLLGADADYVSKLREFSDILEVRISLKAGTPEGFVRRTGCDPRAFQYPFVAIDRVLSAGMTLHLAAMTDPLIMASSERQELIARLNRLCKKYRRTLEITSDVAGGHTSTPRAATLKDPIYLDEECYQSIYPQIVADITETSHKREIDSRRS